VSVPKEPIRGTADGGAHGGSTYTPSEAERTEAEIWRLRSRIEEAQRKKVAARLAAELAEIEAPPIGAASHGGPVPAGNSRERIVDEAIAQREPDGTWPTQVAVAGTLELTDRRIRQVQGKAGWAGILEDAKVKARDR
jgi:hypothetical protein